MQIQAALPRLAAAYHRGLLVPFLGAGMSIGACPDWKALVGRLEKAADVPPPPENGKNSNTEMPDALVRRANHAIRVLTRRRSEALTMVLRDALYASVDGAALSSPPPQTLALARLWWPLVLTTNYDDLFARAYGAACAADSKVSPAASFAARYGPSGHYVDVLGREPADCERVLTSLSQTTTSVLWALHGYLPAEDAVGRHARLARELVVGHAEYRRIAHASVHYRRAFAEVYRRRSFLFLGAGLADVYLLDLFAEVQELHGASPHPHYAMVQRGTVDADFLRTRFNIIALEYDGHGDLPGWLDLLAGAVQAGEGRPTAWAFQAPSGCGTAPGGGNLRILNEPLPERSLDHLSADRACIVVGAARHGGSLTEGWEPWFGDGVKRHVKGHLKTLWDAKRERTLRPASWRLGTRDHLERVLELPATGDTAARNQAPCAVVTAWADEERDLRGVAEATRAALAWAEAGGFRELHLPLLATGSDAHFAPRFALAEIVRAYGRWCREGCSALDLMVHVLAPSAVFELTSGRFDVTELLACGDLRFWIEVQAENGLVEREPVFAGEQDTIGMVAREFAGLPREGWHVELDPSPLQPETAVFDAQHTRWIPRAYTAHKVADRTLAELGVLPGATLRFVLERRVVGVAASTRSPHAPSRGGRATP